MTAVANASVNHVPMLLLTGEVAVCEFGLHHSKISDDGLGLATAFRRLCRASVSIESVANARSKIDRDSALQASPKDRVHIGLPRDLVDERAPVHEAVAAVDGPVSPKTLAPQGSEVAEEVIRRLIYPAPPCSCWGMAAGWTISARKSPRSPRKLGFLLRQPRTGGGSSRKPIRCRSATWLVRRRQGRRIPFRNTV